MKKIIVAFFVFCFVLSLSANAAIETYTWEANIPISTPGVMAMDSSGNLYIWTYDVTGDIQISKILSNGTVIKPWVSLGQGVSVSDIAIDEKNSKIYLALQNESQIKRLNLTDGSVDISWGNNGVIGSPGTNDDQFAMLNSVAIDSAGNIYAGDSRGVRVFNSDGKFPEFLFKDLTIDRLTIDSNNILVVVGRNYSPGAPGRVLARYRVTASSGMPGTIATLLNSIDLGSEICSGLAIDSLGNVYGCMQSSNMVKKFDTNLKLLTSWGGTGSNSGQFDFPAGVEVLGAGEWAYVSDMRNKRIQKFKRIEIADTTTTTVASPAATTTIPGATSTTLPVGNQKFSLFFFVQYVPGSVTDNNDFYYRGGSITSPIKASNVALKNIPVRLLDKSGNQIDKSVTDYSGFIKFRYVEAGYTVQFSRSTVADFTNCYQFNIPSGKAYGSPSPIAGALVTLIPASKPVATTIKPTTTTNKFKPFPTTSKPYPSSTKPYPSTTMFPKPAPIPSPGPVLKPTY